MRREKEKKQNTNQAAAEKWAYRHLDRKVSILSIVVSSAVIAMLHPENRKARLPLIISLTLLNIETIYELLHGRCQCKAAQEVAKEE